DVQAGGPTPVTVLDDGSVQGEFDTPVLGGADVGGVTASVFEEASASDTHEERVASLILKTDRVDYREALDLADDPEAVSSAFEKVADKAAENAVSKAFGPEVPAVFFIRREAEVRAVRIAASMIASGKTADAIKTRIGIK
ncbi:MAG: V-type ATPase subunit, partial [Clostridia bacterium]|nr:V-type ATPase subunit [Clostridia bacterium]